MILALPLMLAAGGAFPAQELKERLTIPGPANGFGSIALSHDGKTLASGSRGYDTKTSKSWGEIQLWDAVTGKERAAWKGHADGITCMRFSPDGKTLATWGGSQDHSVKLWDLETRKERHTFKAESNLAAHLVFSPDGRRLAGADDRSVSLWEVETGRQLGSFSRPGFRYPVAVSPDLKTLAVANHQDVDLWDVDTGQERLSFLDHRGWVNHLAFSADGKTLAVASNRLVSDQTFHCEVKLGDVAAERERLILKGHVGFVHAIALSPDGKVVAVVWSKSLRGRHSLKLIDATAGRAFADVPFENAGSISGLTFSRDGRLLVAAASKQIKVWDVTYPDSSR